MTIDHQTPDWSRPFRPLRYGESWDSFPLGTFAQEYTGHWWVKTAQGWKAGGGDTFPRPGPSALSVQEPITPEAIADSITDRYSNALSALAKDGEG